MNEARGVTLSPLPKKERGMEWSKYWQLVADYREMELTASLEREAELRAEVERLRGKPFSDRMYAALESRLAAAQNAAVQGFEEWWDSPKTSIDYDDAGATARAAWQAATAVQSAAALTRENEQSAMDAATVEERFELRERLKVCEMALEMACSYIERTYPSDSAHYIQKARAELAKENANG
jgi:hypothetical protein